MQERATAHERLYDHRWQKRRRLWLLNHPLCRYCEEAGRPTAATVVDHIIPHKGDEQLFWDETNWQSLCKEHHDAAKQREENQGFSQAVGADGWPIDDRHPANSGVINAEKPKKHWQKGKKRASYGKGGMSKSQT